MGAASIINIALGLIRTKVAAVLLGPSGIGVIGLLQNLIAVSANVASLGFRTVGTRQIAEAAGREDAGALAAARRALFWGTLTLAFTGCGLLWLFRDLVASTVLHDPDRSTDIIWVGIGVALSVATGSQTALLSGMRRIGDLARISVASSVVATVLGAASLLILRERGLLLFILIGPVSTFAIGIWYAKKLNPIRSAPTPIRDLCIRWKNFAFLGTAFMLSGFAETFAELAVRSLVVQQEGLSAAGHFQAAWTISAMYTGFILSAMSADYYPRLSAEFADHATANRLVNDQTQVALLLAGPLLVLMVGFCPLAIHILYSSSFQEAAPVLRLQLLGDVLKIVSWPIGYLILASGDGKRYLFSAAVMAAVFVIATSASLPRFGLEAAGLGFVAMYAAYLPMAYWIGKGKTGFSWDRSVKILFVSTSLVVGAVFVIALWSDIAAMVASTAIACCFGLISAKRLRLLLARGDKGNPGFRPT